ncbi:hypothetical protein DRO58_02550, partial [Candidatus Bathyarchaeota archaeon]
MIPEPETMKQDEAPTLKQRRGQMNRKAITILALAIILAYIMPLALASSTYEVPSVFITGTVQKDIYLASDSAVSIWKYSVEGVDKELSGFEVNGSISIPFYKIKLTKAFEN